MRPAFHTWRFVITSITIKHSEGLRDSGSDISYVSGANSEEIDEWLDETHHKYEHSDDAYSVQVMGALVALALVVAV